MIKTDELKNPGIEFWPDVRWWLAEGFHTDATLKKDISMLHEAGFGAVEFLAMEEPGADSSLYGWGSEEWVHDSHVIIDETTKRSMGVSMTSGTNWSNANLITITPDDRAAAKELDYAVETVCAGHTRSGLILKSILRVPGVTVQELVAVTAARIDRKSGDDCLDQNSVQVLTSLVKDGCLEWTAPGDGDYMIFYFWIHGTGQTASPSAGISYTINYIDHYGIDAFIDYWDSTVLTPQLKENIQKNGRAMMYMDSLELSTFGKGGQFWGYHFLDEFCGRRGYDLTPYLPFIVKNAGMMTVDFVYHYHCADQRFTQKLHNDLYQTMTDLYMENMLKPMQEWLHSHGMTLRAEISYGLPFEISQPGKYVDGIETESLEFASQIEPYRNLAGPAHIYNRTYSSETGATLLNYMMGLEFYTQIIYTQFAAGVTKTVLHGYSSIAGSDDSTYWPGHEGMWPVFSERFGCRQPAWQHYNEWTRMIARYQMVLRKGKPRMDLGILRLDYNFNNLYFDGENEKELYESKLMRGDAGVYWKDMKLQHAGFTWDYFAPQLVEEPFVNFENGQLIPDGPGYQALIIYQEALPLDSSIKLLELAKKGLPLVFVNHVNETIRPSITKTHEQAASMTPFLDGNEEKLSEIIKEIKALSNVREIDDPSMTLETLYELGVHPRTEFLEENEKILTLTRKDGTCTYLYVYHMQYATDAPVTADIALEGQGRLYRIDCWNGRIEKIDDQDMTASVIDGKDDDRTIVRLKLMPGQACLFALKPEEEACLDQAAEKDSVYKEDQGHGIYQIHEAAQAGSQRVIELTDWTLTVEDWNEGEKKQMIEDRGKGIVTREVYYETKKTKLEAGKVELKPWKDIPQIGPQVSGVGYYTCTVTLPKDWNNSQRGILKIASTNGCSAAVYVNGKKADAYDFNAKIVDITSLLVPGENTILVEVTSTLNNRLLARGYYDRVAELSRMLAANASNGHAGEADGQNDQTAKEQDGKQSHPAFNIHAMVQDYGLIGPVTLEII